ncbi:MAG: CBS domain-containing protein, partial [Nitrosopumilaceae archaeon]|nr:CBS domain-containing protein [Nitrosopumilaceae archaeon]NIU85794.1 CBS domain-containing protein [Nitrosopumilaceae archaeon]NIV64653.1 CBS domain-containing protein [Nitrosopumilaceae archaeon]NIX60040.1 CBS domain-containing protein [Nitrosopumilaceae archaeon]
MLKDKSKVGLDKIQLNQFMKESVFVSEDTTLKEAAKIMIDKNIGSLLIGNKQELKGIITKTDIVRYFSENFGGKG